jgi:hypothetical protein
MRCEGHLRLQLWRPKDWPSNSGTAKHVGRSGFGTSFLDRLLKIICHHDRLVRACDFPLQFFSDKAEFVQDGSLNEANDLRSTPDEQHLRQRSSKQ